ncbi:MAG: B12-binding domain-containing radical SAM protein [Candidatus Omnitrophica bacterium]|nr:B12-binding domain-containing radical SAM protein [Candidatus Omnitrophota bacterium]
MRPDIIFLFPSFYGTFSSHLGTGYIIAFLRQRGLHAEQFINYQELRLKEALRAILKKRPRIVGFSCYDTNYFLVKLISRCIKAIDPGILIIAGGPTATFSDRVIMKNIPEVDLCVRHEGEHTVYEIIKQFSSGRGFSGISGITLRNGRQIIRNQDRPLIGSGDCKRSGTLDVLPSPYVSGVIDPNQLVKNKDSVSMIISRGCPHKCAYCNFAIMFGCNVRYHSVERVISELKVINRLSRHKDDFSVIFRDDTFTSNKEKTEQVCRRIIEEKIDLNISIGTRGDYVDKRILKLLYRAGVRHISFGLESAVPKVLYNIKKVRVGDRAKMGFRPEQRFISRMKSSIRSAKKIGFRVSLGVIFGLPEETFRDALRTIELVKGLKVDSYSHNILRLYAGTEMFGRFANNRYKDSEAKFLLPFRQLANSPRIYKYDVTKVPRLKNDYYGRATMARQAVVSKALMGLYKRDIPAKKSLQNIILATNSVPFEWLVETFSLKTNFLFADNMRVLLSQEKDKLKISYFILAKMLALSAYKKNICFTRISDKYIGLYRNHFRTQPYSSFSRYPNGQMEKDVGVIFSISDFRDVDELERQLILMKDKAGKRCPGRKDFNYLLADGCRWAADCPALHLDRLVIDRDLSILPCFQGRPIGKVGDNLDKMKKNMAVYYKKEVKKRGCGSCPARDTCSKCPFLGRITPDRYCGIRRKYSSAVNDYTALINARINLQYSSLII